MISDEPDSCWPPSEFVREPDIARTEGVVPARITNSRWTDHYDDTGHTQ
jgi:hypothetical protein